MKKETTCVAEYADVTKQYSTEAEFLDVNGTKVLRVFPLAIRSHLY